METLASIFADPEDLRRYRAAIASGATENEALKVGDNGEGWKGDNTASFDDPQVALSPDTPGFAYNRLVQIQGPNGPVVARLTDKGPKGRIDLNPAAAAAVGHPGGLIPVKWSFLDGYAPPQKKMSIDRGGGGAPGNAGLPPIEVSMPALEESAPAEEPAPPAIPPILLAQNDVTPGEGADMSGEGEVMSTDNPYPGTVGTPAGIPEINVEAPETDQGTAGIPHVFKGMKPPELGKAVTRNSDGSWTTTTGVRFYPQDGHIEKDAPGGKFMWRFKGDDATFFPIKPPTMQQVKTGDKIFEINPQTGESVDVTPKGYVAPLHDSMFKMLAERQLSPVKEDGTPMSNSEAVQAVTDYDKKAGRLTAYQQHEADKISTILNSSRNRATVPYLQTYGNYKSLEDIAAKPYEQRSGLDDARAIAAFAQIEQPGYQPSQKTIDSVIHSAGIKGALQVNLQRAMGLISGDPAYEKYKATRLLPDFVLDQMADQARAASRPRAEEYLAAIEPLITRAKRAGVLEYVAAQGLLKDAYNLTGRDEDGAPASATPSPSPSATPAASATTPTDQNIYERAMRVKATSTNPTALKQADDALAVLRAKYGKLPNDTESNE